MYAKGTILATGGNDGKVKLWQTAGAALTLTKTIDLTAPNINSAMPKATSVCIGSNDSVLVGTRGGEIIEFLGDQSKVHMRSHYESELWGLAMHPTLP